MKELYPRVALAELCGLFGYTRQNYYKRRSHQQRREQEEQAIVDQVRRWRQDQPRLGTIKLQHMLNEQEAALPIGRDRLYELLRKHHLLIRRRRKYRPRHTDGNGRSLYEDLRKGLKVTRINQLWCSDITYIELRDRPRFCYLICVTDEFSHLIVGYHLGLRMRTREVLMAFRMAIEGQLGGQRPAFQDPLIIHTDRGSQYKSAGYQTFVKPYNIRCSMCAAGKSHENPVAERLNGILKDELLTQDRFDSLALASQAVDKAIRIYNEQRPHLSCELLTPSQAHQLGQGPLKKLWRQRKARTSAKPDGGF